MVPAGIRPSVRRLRLTPLPLLLGPVLAGGLLAGCGGGDLVLPPSESAAVVRVVDGDGQQGQVGQLLASPIVVQVADSAGNPVPGASVQFVLVSAGDSADIQPATATTDQQGRAEARMLLGDKVGLQTGEARLGQGANPPTAQFTAVATSVPGNQPPAAGFNWHCDHLDCRFTDASTDADGTVTAWSWQFGDGESSTDRSPAHTYAAAGTYTVQLTVTDDGGATGQLSQQVTVSAPSSPPPPPPPPANKAPVADFELHCHHLECDFTDRSSDPDGVVVTWHWDFGDGETSFDPSPTHTYAGRGHYQVSLTVTDNDGASDTKTRTADVKK